MLIELFLLRVTAEELRAKIDRKSAHCKEVGQIDRVGANSPIFDLFSLVAPNIYLSVKNVSDRVVRPNYPCKNDRINYLSYGIKI